jgi:hypothetical protein
MPLSKPSGVADAGAAEERGLVAQTSLITRRHAGCCSPAAALKRSSPDLLQSGRDLNERDETDHSFPIALRQYERSASAATLNRVLTLRDPFANGS